MEKCTRTYECLTCRNSELRVKWHQEGQVFKNLLCPMSPAELRGEQRGVTICSYCSYTLACVCKHFLKYLLF